MSEKKPIPTRVLYPVAFACLAIVAAVALGVPDLIVAPIAVITVVWASVLVVRHYTARKEDA